MPPHGSSARPRLDQESDASTACFMAAETYVNVRSDGLHGLHNVCRPLATHAEQVLAEAYPIRLSANRAYEEAGWYSGALSFEGARS